MALVLKKLFETPYFRITVVPDAETVELCGALKVSHSPSVHSPCSRHVSTYLYFLCNVNLNQCFHFYGLDARLM